MHRRHLALLFLVPLAFPGAGGCDGDEKASQESGETTAGAEATPSTNQRREAADSTEGSEEPSASAADEQTAIPDRDAVPEPPGPARVAASDDGKAAAQELGCTACHGATIQLVGPSYQAVAEKYDGDEAKILERIKMAVKDGASGSWSDVTGGTPMPPQPQAADKPGQLEAIAGWIAGMAE